MKKFRFPLETVLTFRAHLEDKEKQLLASMRLLYEHERQRLSEVEARYAQVQTELAGREATRFDKGESHVYRLYLRRLLSTIQSKRTQLETLRTQVDKQQQVVLQAYKNRRILELLKAKQWQAYTLAYNKEEQRLVDELQLAKYNHGRIEE